MVHDGANGLHWRSIAVEGIGPWVWIEADYWAFQHCGQNFPVLRDLILQHTDSKRAIVQAGGCCGMYPRLWAESFDTVYTFEPDYHNFYCLAMNCSQERIIKFQAALGDKPGLCSLSPGPVDNVGMCYINGPGDIPVLRLDDMGLTAIDAIQLDCEGYEHKVIMGSLDLIKACHPVIAVEAPTDELCDMLAGLSYEKVGEAGCCGSSPDLVFRWSGS